MPPIQQEHPSGAAEDSQTDIQSVYAGCFRRFIAPFAAGRSFRPAILPDPAGPSTLKPALPQIHFAPQQLSPPSRSG